MRRHCEPQAKQSRYSPRKQAAYMAARSLDCFAALAMTAQRVLAGQMETAWILMRPAIAVQWDSGRSFRSSNQSVTSLHYNIVELRPGC
jgi:hypothetical protein